MLEYYLLINDTQKITTSIRSFTHCVGSIGRYIAIKIIGGAYVILILQATLICDITFDFMNLFNSFHFIKGLALSRIVLSHRNYTRCFHFISFLGKQEESEFCI